MSNHRVVVVLGIALAACGGGRGPKVVLRYHPPAGAVYHYGLEQHTRMGADSGPMAALGKQDVVMRAYFTQTVKGPVSGGTEVEVVFESMTMEMPGLPSRPSQGVPGMAGARATYVFDDRGTVVRGDFTQMPGVSAEMAKRISAGVSTMSSLGFPTDAVGRGDSWTVSSKMPLDQMPGITASTQEMARSTFTIREVRIAGADTSIVFDITTEFPKEPIQLASAEETASLKLDGQMRGQQTFSLTRGTIVDATMKGDMGMTITASGPRGGTMSMRMDNENSIVLLPDK